MEKVIKIYATKEAADIAFRKMLQQSFNQPMEGDISIVSYDELYDILTPERLNLIKRIQELKPESIEDLAERLNRDIDSLKEDLKLLACLGLIKVENGKLYCPYTDLKIVFDEFIKDIL
jgi:predicted transcriptional regulator